MGFHAVTGQQLENQRTQIKAIKTSKPILDKVYEKTQKGPFFFVLRE